jgi:pSer/pThr/pTyr-binding forkhead associated (FHA) protein
LHWSFAGWHLQYDSGVDEEIGDIPQNAFFVIEGVKVYPLVKKLISIGRRVENDLVIDDPRVSRRHAQLRANQEQGQFVLIDLNSTGGTFVNGRRINQSILYPGDVISIGGLLLTFNQDEPPPRPDLIDTVR